MTTHHRQALLVVGVQILLVCFFAAITSTNGYVVAPPTLTILNRINKALSDSQSLDAKIVPKQQQHTTTTTTTTTTLDTTKIGSLTVPSVGVGTISWSSSSFTKIENDDLQKVISTAYQSNGAFFDTAERYGSHAKTAFGFGYGETEKLTSKLLRRAATAAQQQQQQQQQPLQQPLPLTPVVATKFTPTPWRTTVQSMVDACEQSRTNLGVDQIDLYQIHMPDIVQPFRFLGRDQVKDSMYWDGLAECYHRGLVKNVGVCNYGPTLVAQCQEHLAKRGVPLASNQIGYSLVGRQGGAQETLDKCQELGVAVMAFYPFAMGLLTGKYTSQELEADSDNDNDDHHLSSSSSSLVTKKKTSLELRDLERYAKGDGVKIPKGGIAPLIRTMEVIAKNNNKTVAQVALNYILCKGAIPIPGARTVEQLQDNLGAMGWRLSDTEVAMLELSADQLGFAFDGAGFKRTNEKFVGYGVEKFYLD